MESDMERVKRSLAPEIHAGIAKSGVDWLVDLAAECMATLTAAELDALEKGVLRPSGDALTALAEREKANPHADDDEADDPDDDFVDLVDEDDRQIVSFFHCAQCLDERPEGQSPRDWTRLEFGLTADRRLQVWCLRHEREVGTFLLAPQRIRVGSGCGHVAN